MEDLAQASFDSPIQRPDEKPKIPGPHRSMDLHSREAPGTHHSATVGVVDREWIQDVENRKWCPPRGTEDILIHAGLDNCDLSEERLQEIEEEHGVKLPREFEQGGIVGVVAVQACHLEPLSLARIRFKRLDARPSPPPQISKMPGTA